MTNKTIVYGAGGHGQVILNAIEAGGKYAVVGFIDDDTAITTTLSHRRLGSRSALSGLIESGIRHCHVAIGSNDLRRSLSAIITKFGFEPLLVVHPFSSISKGVELGSGVAILSGVSVNPKVTIGDGAIINCNALISHDSEVGNFVHLSLGSICGARVTIGDGTFVGMGASIMPGVKVGSNSIIGAGSLVNKNVPDNVIAFGAPAKVIRENSKVEPTPEG